MELLKFILWLTTGAVIGWFAKQVVASEYGMTHKLVPARVSKPIKR